MVWKLPDLLDLTFLPLDQLTTPHKVYLQLLTDKEECDSWGIVWFQDKNSTGKSFKCINVVKIWNFSGGDLVHQIYYPYRWVQPHLKYIYIYRFLVMDMIFYSTQYELKELGNIVLLDTFHINRLKLAFVSMPTGTINSE